MDCRLAVLLPLLALVACGGGGSRDDGRPGSESWARNLIGNEGSPGFRRPDGSFDRADYRRVMVPSCAEGMRQGNPAIPPAEVQRVCTCLVEGVLAATSDAELFAMNRDQALQQRTYDAATPACRPSRPYALPGDRPPPEEPVPSLNDSLPPPIEAPPPPR